MRPAEHEEIIKALNGLFPNRSLARAMAEGCADGQQQAWRSLSQLGLIGVILPPSLGGSGATLSEELLIAEILGGWVLPVPISAAFLAAHILAAGEGPRVGELCHGLCDGSQIIGALLSANAASATGLTLKRDEDDPSLGELTGIVTDALDTAELDGCLVLVEGSWWFVELRNEHVERVPLLSLDPTRPLSTLALHGARAELVSDFDPKELERLAWLFMAAEATGVAAAALELSRTYALERHQFGEPIGRFQAIKHKLTDALVAVEGARSSLIAASGTGGILETRKARMAKAVATAASVSVVFEAIQIHGAFGNTWESDLHLLLRRAKFCQLCLGSSDTHLTELAQDLLSSANVVRTGTRWDVDLQLKQADQEFLSELRAWLDENAPPERIKEIRRGGPTARRQWQAQLADARWAGIHWPARYGGRDASFIEQVLYHCELAERGLPGLIGNRGLSLVGPTLIHHGSPDQQARFLEATRRADILWASGFSEPGAGSDLASLRTRAVADGDCLVINGQKTWTSNADISQMMFTLVRTGPPVPKHEGISCVLLPLDAPGVKLRPIRRMHGTMEFFEVFLDDVRVPIANVVGAINNGWQVARTTLSHEHMTNFLGTQMRNAFLVQKLIAELARIEEKMGSADVNLRRRVIQAWINTHLLRTHGLRNIAQISAGGEAGAEGSILKLFGQEEERRLFELALDIKGTDGLTSQREINNFLSARAATVGGGTSEVHRNKIAERVLGMPRDSWSDDTTS